MDKEKMTVLISNKRQILRVLDGKTEKTAKTVKNASWMPASAGMTMDVGGNAR